MGEKEGKGIDLEEQTEDTQHDTCLLLLSIHSYPLLGEKCETPTQGIQEVLPSYCTIAKYNQFGHNSM